MNARFYRTAIATVLFAVQLLVAAATPARASAPVDCAMACCAASECACSEAPLDMPERPAPAAPVPFDEQPKFYPVLLAIVPAPDYAGATAAASKAADWRSLRAEARQALFRLNCSLLM